MTLVMARVKDGHLVPMDGTTPRNPIGVGFHLDMADKNLGWAAGWLDGIRDDLVQEIDALRAKLREYNPPVTGE
jgi:hypothetical protein